MRIRSKLLVNIIITVVCLGIVGGIGFFYTRHVAHMSLSLVKIEAIPILEINKLEKTAWEMWLRLIVHTSVSEVETMQQLEQEIAQLEKVVAVQLRKIKQHYELENKHHQHHEQFDNKEVFAQTEFDVTKHIKLLQNFQIDWQQFHQIADNVLLLSQDFTKEDALQLIIREGRVKYDQAISDLRQMIDEHRRHMETLNQAALNAQHQAAVAIITLTVLIGLVVFLIINHFSRRLLTPLLQINTHLKILAQGQVIKDHLEYQGNDEIGEIVISAQQLKDSMNDTIEQANAIAAGNYHKEIKRLSEQDQLGQALSDMTQTLRQVTQENSQQDWLKTGQNQLNDQMSGEQNLTDLGHNIVSFLTLYLEAQVGLLYWVEQTATQLNQRLKIQLIASYAYTRRKNLADEFQFSQGLVERAAKEQRQIFFTLNTGLGEEIPRHLLVIPCLHETQVKGVIVLGSETSLGELQLNFLTQVMPAIGIAVNSIESRVKMQELLQQTQIQAEKLQTQKAELQYQKEELQHQKEELQSQSEELQSQSEELQSQTEELRQTNEELEERTHELERQREQIREKNQILEQSKQILQAKAEELELASKYKSEFLANMSHELRTPLNSLLILAQLLADNKPGNLNDKQVEYAKTIHSAGSDLLSLINEILDLSKVEAGKIEVHPEDVSLGDLVETLEHKFRPLAKEQGLAFHLTVAEELPAILHTDPQRFKQILNNLLSNAFKFTSEGEIKLTMRRPLEHEDISGLALEKNKTVVITVSDTGIGIPLNKQKIIFEAFQQVDGTTSRRYGGTGLGLSISRQLVRLLGGEIQLSSEENKGSTFTFYLPEKLEKPPLKSQSMTQTPVPSPKTDFSSPLEEVSIPSSPTAAALNDDRAALQPGDRFILIVEDDRKFSRILMELAQEKNFKCLIAEDGKTGLQLAEQYQPHAIVLDVGLPQVDGWTVMEKLKDNPNTRHIPVHFMSASDQSLDARKMGAIGYLLKPISMAELGEAFKKIEQFIAKTVKNLLLVVDKSERQQEILDLVGTKEVQPIVAQTKVDAMQQLHETPVDVVVLDLDVEQGSGIKLLLQLEKEDQLIQIPVIVYADRDLNSTEETILQRCADNLTVKAVRSPERLLDEATLFLHQVEANLPKEKRHMLRMVHDKTAILRGKKILIVDDDMRNTFALATVLEDQEMEVVVGKNGKEALQLLEQHPDVTMVLMDIMMPEMDGYEAMQRIRAQSRFRKLPIIALTAKAMKGDKAKCIQAGANDYLSKPVDMDKLVSLLRVWLYR